MRPRMRRVLRRARPARDTLPREAHGMGRFLDKQAHPARAV